MGEGIRGKVFFGLFIMLSTYGCDLLVEGKVKSKIYEKAEWGLTGYEACSQKFRSGNGWTTCVIYVESLLLLKRLL